MFERYTERARRVIFFARYEASMFGSTAIETEHLLLGLIREDKYLTSRFLRRSSESIRKEIEMRTTIRERVSTSIDLPLSDECKRILAYAAEEAERLSHRHIGTQHLLLGILREKNCLAAQVLTEMGLAPDTVREKLATTPSADESGLAGDLRTVHSSIPDIPDTPMPAAGVVPDAETAKRIAEAVWMPRLISTRGDRLEASNAELKHGVWIVMGSQTGENSQANTLVAFIQKEDGKILRVERETPGS